MAVLIIIYIMAGYWAVGQTLWRNKTIVEFKPGAAFVQGAVLGAILGWILIPVAIIRKITGK